MASTATYRTNATQSPRHGLDGAAVAGGQLGGSQFGVEKEHSAGPERFDSGDVGDFE